MMISLPATASLRQIYDEQNEAVINNRLLNFANNSYRCVIPLLPTIATCPVNCNGGHVPKAKAIAGCQPLSGNFSKIGCALDLSTSSSYSTRRFKVEFMRSIWYSLLVTQPFYF